MRRNNRGVGVDLVVMVMTKNSRGGRSNSIGAVGVVVAGGCGVLSGEQSPTAYYVGANLRQKNM